MTLQNFFEFKNKKYLIEPSKKQNKMFDLYLVTDSSHKGFEYLKPNQFIKVFVSSFGKKN